MRIRERENAYVNAQIQRLTQARELASEFTSEVMDHLEPEIWDLFEMEHEPRIHREHEDHIRDLQAAHEDEIEERAEEIAKRKIQILRARCERAEKAARYHWTIGAKARLFDLHNLAGQPLGLTAAQKRSEVWKLRQELKDALEHIAELGDDPVKDGPDAKVIPLTRSEQP